MARAANSVSIHLGTSAFVADGWEHSFYPKGMRPSDYLTYYATRFDTVEIDSTFYHAAAPPAGALISLPVVITHRAPVGRTE